MPVYKLCDDGRTFKVKEKYAEGYHDLMRELHKENLFVKTEIQDHEAVKGKFMEGIVGGQAIRYENSPWVILKLPALIDSNMKFFMVVHEVAHVVLGHLDFNNPEPGIKEEVEANNWALAKFKEWGLRRTFAIQLFVYRYEKLLVNKYLV